MPKQVQSLISSTLANRLQHGVMAYTYKGVPSLKSPFDMAIYTQLFYDLRPGSILEFGSNRGGSALWMADTLQMLGVTAPIYSFDIKEVRDVSDPRIEFRYCDVSDIDAHISDAFIASLPRPILVVEDSSHTYQHVLNVLRFFDRWSAPGDYIIIEDGVISIQDVEAAYGGGPFQAIHAFLNSQPAGRYEIDRQRCDFFGDNVTWNPDGYIKRLDERAYQAPRVVSAVVSAMRPEEGLCWAAELPSEWPEGDGPGREATSSLKVFEDGRALGPAHSAHADIRKLGGGAFSHWGRSLLFSTSDGTSPLSNGRTYSVEVVA